MRDRDYRKIRLFLYFGLVLGLAGVSAYWLINDTITTLVKHQAVTMAEIVARQAASARSVYGKEVAGKLRQDGFGPHLDYKQQKGHVPLPAQFLKMLGKATTQDSAHLYEYWPVSKWNLEPSQGLSDDFLQWAWPQLEAQDLANPDGPIAWKPVWRIETIEQKRVLRYLQPDPASSASCVSCHNGYELRPEIKALRTADNIALGKQWKQHQLLGGLSVVIPLGKVEIIAAEQIQRTLLSIGAVFVICVAIIIGFLLRHFQYVSSLANLSWQASHDPLTGLFNRRGFEYEAQLLWESVRQRGKVHVLCLIDLDGFKLINDTYGHQAGDDILIEVAKGLESGVRRGDVVARLGGDEFAVLLNECSMSTAQRIAETIRKTICAATIKIDGVETGVQASIGLSLLDLHSESIEQVFKAADQACYTAKNTGKNRVSLHPSGIDPD